MASKERLPGAGPGVAESSIMTRYNSMRMGDMISTDLAQLKLLSDHLPWVLEPTETLDLSVLTFNALTVRAGLLCLGQLVQVTEIALLKVPNFGRKSLKQVREALGRRGLCLGMVFPTTAGGLDVAATRGSSTGEGMTDKGAGALAAGQGHMPGGLLCSPSSVCEDLCLGGILPDTSWQDLLSLSPRTCDGLWFHSGIHTIQELVEALRCGRLSTRLLGQEQLTELADELALLGINDSPRGSVAPGYRPEDIRILCDLALRRLPPRERLYVEGHFLQGLPISRIARDEGRSGERGRQIKMKGLRRAPWYLRELFRRRVAMVVDALPEDGSPLAPERVSELCGEADLGFVGLAIAFSHLATTVVRRGGLSLGRRKLSPLDRLG